MHATKTTVSPLYCTGMCIDLCIQFTLMFWLLSTKQEYLLYILSSMWGVTDGIFKTQISGKLEYRAYIFIHRSRRAASKRIPSHQLNLFWTMVLFSITN